MNKSIELIKGGLSVDDRGNVVYVNQLDMNSIKRFYIVTNNNANFVRAWHAHKNEGKYAMVLEGSAVVAAVEIDDYDSPSRDLVPNKYVLSDKQSAVVYIPPGYANGFMSLVDGTKILYFSTSTLADSIKDDIRYDAYYWDCWSIEER